MAEPVKLETETIDNLLADRPRTGRFDNRFRHRSYL